MFARVQCAPPPLSLSPNCLMKNMPYLKADVASYFLITLSLIYDLSETLCTEWMCCRRSSVISIGYWCAIMLELPMLGCALIFGFAFIDVFLQPVPTPLQWEALHSKRPRLGLMLQRQRKFFFVLLILVPLCCWVEDGFLCVRMLPRHISRVALLLQLATFACV